ncbi:MAG TPA: RNA-binding domain-containing protein [Pyrinomonadaceae bacterium]|jgi:ATP-dependent DNA helicase RecG|nr:RNA-binding domain-containing protein [Pyrinomonadaceae bacterium]
MARKRFRSSQRNEPVTDRSFQEYLYQTAAPLTTRTELMRLVRGGEDTYLELKVKLSNSERIAQGIVALANTGGGTMVFGVNDQMRVEGIDHPEEVQDELVRICREEIIPPLIPFIDRIAFDNGRRIVALDIDGKRRPYRTRDGRFFIRVGENKRETSPEELSSLLDDARPLLYEDIPVTRATLGDIDEAHLWSFMRAFEGGAFDESSARGYPTSEILERYFALAVKSQDEITPSVAGIVLFGRDESVAKLLPRTSIVATRFSGDNVQAPVIERLELHGNLATLYESAQGFVRRYCDLWDTRPSRVAAEAAPVVARANYHRGVIGEAIANALIHRDLVVRDVTTRLHIFDHAIEIVNPRRSAGFAPQALKSIRFGVQQRLNPRTSSVFSNSAYGLQLVRGGLPAMLRAARAFSNRLPEIVAFNDEFRLRIHGV